MAKDKKAAAVPYLHKHVLRKEMSWLLQTHTAAGTNQVEWAAITMKELLQWAPDECSELRPLHDKSVQEVMAHCGQLEPLMLPAYACLTRNIRATGREKILFEHSNRDAVLAAIASFEKSFGVKPSPLQLVKTLSQQSSGTSASVVEPGGGSPDSGARAVGSSSASGAQRCGSPPAGTEGDGEHSASQAAARWYPLKSQKCARRCCCTGNCFSSCPARAPSGEGCPNPAAPGEITCKRYRPLCLACRCRVPDCWAAARRPYGPHNLSVNWGKCQRHWFLPPKKAKCGRAGKTKASQSSST